MLLLVVPGDVAFSTKSKYYLIVIGISNILIQKRLFSKICSFLCTDANKSLTTLVVKHYNDLLGSHGIQTSERGRDKVTFSYVAGLF